MAATASMELFRSVIDDRTDELSIYLRENGLDVGKLVHLACQIPELWDVVFAARYAAVTDSSEVRRKALARVVRDAYEGRSDPTVLDLSKKLTQALGNVGEVEARVLAVSHRLGGVWSSGADSRGVGESVSGTSRDLILAEAADLEMILDRVIATLHREGLIRDQGSFGGGSLNNFALTPFGVRLLEYIVEKQEI